MKLLSIDIKNFKGLKSLSHDFDGDDTVITAQNKGGKTSFNDAFRWLLFGTDSDGKTDFSVRPLDKNNQVQEKLVIGVSCMISIQSPIPGTVPQKIELRKENKASTNGYSNKFWIDGVPKKAGEFASFVNDICDEDTFKMLTDLQYFNGKMHWQERRNVLLELAGKEISKPVGFESLIADMANLEIDDYKKVITGRRKLEQIKLDELNPRVDEMQLALSDVTITDGLIDLVDEREQVEGKIATLDAELNEITIKRVEIRQKEQIIHGCEYELATLETRIKTDKSHVSKYTEEIGQIKKAQSERETELANQKEMVKRKEIEISTIDHNISTQQRSIEKVRESFKAAKESTIDTTCYACGQDLPDDKITEVKDKQAKELSNIAKSGKSLQVLLADLQGKKETAETELKELTGELDDMDRMYSDYKGIDGEKIGKLQSIIDSQQTPDPCQDTDWQLLHRKIQDLKCNLPTIDESRIADINRERESLQELLAKADKAFAQKDTIERNRERIVQLEQEGKELACKITELDGKLEQIKMYKQAESDMIVKAVNSQFKHVTFKLFETQINGDTRDCCTALSNGVPYPDMSTGQKIQAGIDIVERLSEHYGKSMVLFIDNAESLTLPIEHSGQTIKLVADKSVKTLTFTKG